MTSPSQLVLMDPSATALEAARTASSATRSVTMDSTAALNAGLENPTALGPPRTVTLTMVSESIMQELTGQETRDTTGDHKHYIYKALRYV